MSENWFDKKMKHLTSRVSVSTWKRIQIKCKIIPLLKQNLKINISYQIIQHQIIQHQRSLFMFVKDRSILLIVGTNNSKSKCHLARFAMKGGQVHEPGQFTKENILLEKFKHPSTNQSWWPMEDPCKQHWEGWWNETFVK